MTVKEAALSLARSHFRLLKLRDAVGDDHPCTQLEAKLHTERAAVLAEAMQKAPEEVPERRLLLAAIVKEPVTREDAHEILAATLLLERIADSGDSGP
jgi:hypothetical protein